MPDVSLTSAGHDGYLIYQNGGLYVVGGTSAAAPSFAGVMALVVQNAAVRQGSANPVMYSLAGKQRAGGAAVFHDITSGSNSVPGQAGFNATAGYDEATGLGSIDALLLVNHWRDATATPAFHASAAASSLALTAGSNSSTTLTVTVSGGFDAAVSFSVTGLPSGISASFSRAVLPAPGSGASVLKLSATSSVKAGTYSATVSASNGATKQTIPLSIICSAHH